MFAIILDKNKYLIDISSKFRTPESIVIESIPDEDPEKLQCYQYIEGKFVLDDEKWAAIEAERAKMARNVEIKKEINSLKETLNSTDYQIIKCYEYALNDLEMPYDVKKIHAERQALRDKINELETNLQ